MSAENRKEELAKQYGQDKAIIVKQERISQLVSVEMPQSWKVSEKGREAVKAAMAMHSTKHGLYASIPMLCKGNRCPYAKVCPLVDQDMAPEGERCPMEIGIILNKFEDYKREFMIEEDNIVDMDLTKDLIDCDIQIFRAENKMAVEGDFVEDVVVTVSESGEAITNKQISKAAEYKEKILNKKHKILNLMNSTRKDKAGDKISIQLDPSTYAAQLMKQVAEMNKGGGQIIDAEFVEADE